MKRFCIVLVLTIWLVGCGTYDLQVYGPLDPTARTITVPAGGLGLPGKVKVMLQEEGWTLTVDRGPNVAEGTVGKETHLEMYGSFSTRYRLHLSCQPLPDPSWRFQVVYIYDISIIDNKTGREVLTLSGGAEEKVIVKKLREALRTVPTTAGVAPPASPAGPARRQVE